MATERSMDQNYRPMRRTCERKLGNGRQRQDVGQAQFHALNQGARRFSEEKLNLEGLS